MFKWLKNTWNKKMDKILIEEYPWMHYRLRKSTAIQLALSEQQKQIQSHIYSYRREYTKWEYFQIRLKQSLTELKDSFLREIKHYTKLKNLKHLLMRGLQKTSVLKKALQVVTKYAIRLVSATSELFHRFSLFVLGKVHTKEPLPSICTDCGLPFDYKTEKGEIHRFRYPDNQSKHLICGILEEISYE